MSIFSATISIVCCDMLLCYNKILLHNVPSA